ncbi:MAG: InlB B-repeat-containing protein, partial [Anaerolineae bacterium]
MGRKQPSAQNRQRRSHPHGYLAKILRVLLALLYIASLVVFASPPVEAQAPYSWVAYNDLAWATGQPEAKITKYTITGSTSGTLVDYGTGSPVSAQVQISLSGSMTVTASGDRAGSEPASGTDAYDTFHGIVDSTGLVVYTGGSWSVTLTFTGLDPARTYTFATTANRDGGYSDRYSRFTISGADSATNASTPGVTVISNESVAFNTGENTAEGYVARWTGIQPGSDGSFTVTVAPHQGNSAYGPSVFMLAEEAGGDPPVQHTLSVTNDGNGSVALSPAGPVYNAGTVVTLTPVPAAGYQFSGWTGDNAADLVDNGNGTWS